MNNHLPTCTTIKDVWSLLFWFYNWRWIASLQIHVDSLTEVQKDRGQRQRLDYRHINRRRWHKRQFLHLVTNITLFCFGIQAHTSFRASFVWSFWLLQISVDKLFSSVALCEFFVQVFLYFLCFWSLKFNFVTYFVLFC